MTVSQQISSLFTDLEHLCIDDKNWLKKKWHKLKFAKEINEQTFLAFKAQLEKAKQKLERRTQKLPKSIEYPDFLPVTQKKDEIKSLIKNNQVTIIAGETGSGKTTQIPKICLELGLGVKGKIGLTQPRRIAARSVSNRIADELKTELGDLIGFKIRFTDKVSELTLVKVMTDGILLSEIQQDPMLLNYDTIIIDEAHERSLNIDFIIGYLKKLIIKRPDLKVIITSATIDVEKFSLHFSHAPIIEIPGSTYPVEVRYRPCHDSTDEFSSIVSAIDELSFEDPLGDILIFLSGEKEIHELEKSLNKLNYKFTEILPLYARLSTNLQNKIFQPHSQRRIILSTNVAETSVTVPGIKFVIDTGKARISHYSIRSKVQQLLLSPISRASANQRKGRCGRTSNGICIRLYDEQDFLARDEFTKPEILRTNLASVILKMITLDLGKITDFPFIDAPDQKNINDGFKLLQELNAVTLKKNQYHLTSIGQMIAPLPIDPKFARMLVEAQKYSCVDNVMIIASGLSIQDPRERPFDKKQQSDQMHARFNDKQSDFITLLNLWYYIKENQQTLTNNQFRQLCKKEYLSYLKIKEWQDIYDQIKQVAQQLKFKFDNEQADYQSLHKVIATGLLSNIGMKNLESHEYNGARNNKFFIMPNSAIFKSPPKWCLCSQLMQTTKLWGKTAAMIEPDWIESVASHLTKKHYSDPRWSKKQGTTLASLKITLYGLPLITNKTVHYHKVDPKISREFLIREGFIAGEIIAPPSFLEKNLQLMQEVTYLEHKYRDKTILIDEDQLFDFYDQKIPADVACVADFNLWWKSARQKDPNLLTFTKNQLINQLDIANENAFPDYWHYNDALTFKLNYHYDTTFDRDGVTIDIPISVLNQITNTAIFDWHINGLRQDLVIALIKSLPKSLRRNLVPAVNYANAFLERVKPYDGNLFEVLESEFRKITGVKINREDWQLEQVPSYLKITFNIVDENNKTILSGKNLDEIKKQLDTKIAKVLTEISEDKTNTIEQSNITSWNFGDLPKVYEKKKHNLIIKAYPALIDHKKTVAIKLVNSCDEQTYLMHQGLRRLAYFYFETETKQLKVKLNATLKMQLACIKIFSIDDFVQDVMLCSIDYIISKQQKLIFEQPRFLKLIDEIKSNINELNQAVLQKIEKIIPIYININKKFKSVHSLNIALSVADIKQHLSQLICKDFITSTGYEKLTDLNRYLQAIEMRFDKLQQNPNKDRLQLLVIDKITKIYQQLQKQNDIKKYEFLTDLKWMIEELRVNLFAQQLGNPYPISEKRIMQFIAQNDVK